MLDAANTICNGYVCALQHGQLVYSNKYVKRGRWYFEVTHIKGDFMFNAGFSLGKSSSFITFFPYKARVGRSGDSTVYYETNTIQSSEISPYGQLRASTFFEKQTYGVGIDIDTKLLLIQSSQEIRRYQFSILKQNTTNWHIILGEARPPDAFVIDTISYNFGQGPFNLKVPYGFQPFIEDYNNICHTLFSSYQINLMILHIITIFTSDSFL